MLRINLPFLSFVEQLHRSGQIQVKHFKKGDLIVRQGYSLPKVYILRNGISKCYYSAENGKDYILEFLSAGELLGEIEVIKNRDCLCSVETLTNVEAFAIPVSTFKSMLQNDIAFNSLLIDEMAEKIVNTTTRSSVQQLYKIRPALEKLLALQIQQNVTLSKDDMAAYLGITLRSLNRLLKELTGEER